MRHKFGALENGTHKIEDELKDRFHHIRRWCDKFNTYYVWVEQNRTLVQTHDERVEYVVRVFEMIYHPLRFPWVDCWEIYRQLKMNIPGKHLYRYYYCSWKHKKKKKVEDIRSGATESLYSVDLWFILDSLRQNQKK